MKRKRRSQHNATRCLCSSISGTPSAPGCQLRQYVKAVDFLFRTIQTGMGQHQHSTATCCEGLLDTIIRFRRLLPRFCFPTFTGISLSQEDWKSRRRECMSTGSISGIVPTHHLSNYWRNLLSWHVVIRTQGICTATFAPQAQDRFLLGSSAPPSPCFLVDFFGDVFAYIAIKFSISSPNDL